MNTPESTSHFESEPTFIPVLSPVIPESEIPENVRDELQALSLAKADFMASADELVQFLRPEVERLTIDLVQRSLALAWAKRSKI